MTGYSPVTPSSGGGQDTQKAYFAVYSTENITVNADAANPSVINGIQESVPSVGFEISDAANGAIKNTSGRTIQVVTGTVSFMPDNSGAASLINLVSERSSDDGATWTGNLLSLRPIEVSSATENFGTKISLAINWLPNEIIRFRVFDEGGGSIQLQSQTKTILGQSFVAPSFEWELSEP